MANKKRQNNEGASSVAQDFVNARALRIRAAEGHPVNLEKALIVEMPQIKGKDGQ